MTHVNYITTPIFYANDKPHIGHAYTEVAADLLARSSRQRGVETYMSAGTDEHGEKIMRTAVANGMTPKEWVDSLVESSWQPLLRMLNISEDGFIRTTDERHVSAVQKFLVSLRDAGYIYEGVHEGFYCIGCEEYKQPGEYIEHDGVFDCLIHGRPLEFIAERNYFFKLSEFSDILIRHYCDNPDALQPEPVRNEILRFLESGVRDISITRTSFDWGIRVPWDDEHVVYVWFDALINYISAVGWSDDKVNFDRLWPATHIVGKDIARLHAVLWPAMLLAAELPLPRKIFGHGWLLVNGEKMSKTKLTGISPSQIVDVFGVDGFRYYFLRTFRFGYDGSFSWEDMEARYNSDLANGLGNLSSRVTAMIDRYSGGEIAAAESFKVAAPHWVERVENAVALFDSAVGEFRLHDAVNAAWSLVDGLNQYITEMAPWKMAKDSTAAERLEQLLGELRAVLLVVASLLFPVMPAAMSKLWQGLDGHAIGDISAIAPSEILTNAPILGGRVSQISPLFARVSLEGTPLGVQAVGGAF